MDKLDARLQGLVARAGEDARAAARARMAPDGAEQAAAEAEAEPAPTVDVFVEFTGDPEELKALGLRNATVVDHPDGYRIAAGQLPADRVAEVAALPHVRWMEGGAELRSELNTSRGSIRAAQLYHGSPALRGQGVLVGIIDRDFDIRHPSLCTERRNPDGTTRWLTRVRSAWVQRPHRPGEPAPVEFPDLGREYERAELQEIIDAPPGDRRIYTSGLLVSRTGPAQQGEGHGTHVAGIAAGNGAHDDGCTRALTYVGIASEADLILVSHWGEPQMWTSVRLVQAVEYIFNRADVWGMPCVINLSIGDNLGAHDGQGSAERCIDALVRARPGRVVVKSSGNEGAVRRHTFQLIPPGGNATLEVVLDKPFSGSALLDLWYDAGLSLGVDVTAPVASAQTSSISTPGNNLTAWPSLPGATASQQVNVDVIHESNPLSGNRVMVTLRQPSASPIPAGTWRVRVHNSAITHTAFHAWIERNDGPGAPAFAANQANPACTITSPGTAEHVITVGGYADRRASDDLVAGALGAFSSRGPTRTAAYLKPELVAPGASIRAARSDVQRHSQGCCDWCTQHYTDKSGTSMAAPHVTGVVALMLQVNPALTVTEVRQHLQDGAYKTIPNQTLPNPEWGHGIVDAAGAVARVRGEQVPPVQSPPWQSSLLLSGPTLAGARAAPDAAALVDPARLADEPGELLLRVRGLQRELLRTPQGSVYAALVSLHLDEVRRLVNTNRRMAVIWRRNGGPELVRAAMASLNDPTLSLPAEIGGEPAAERIGRILDGLARYAGPALAADARRHRALLQALAGVSPAQLLARLRAAA